MKKDGVDGRAGAHMRMGRRFFFRGAGAADWGGTRCDEIVSVQGGQRPEVCGAILLRARETILGLLAGQGIDPSLPREETHGF